MLAPRALIGRTLASTGRPNSGRSAGEGLAPICFGAFPRAHSRTGGGQRAPLQGEQMHMVRRLRPVKLIRRCPVEPHKVRPAPADTPTISMLSPTMAKHHRAHPPRFEETTWLTKR